MDNSQLSSPSRKLRGQRYARKFGGEWACTGDRLRCVCRACKFYRREHWGLTALSSSEESSSEDEEGERDMYHPGVIIRGLHVQCHLRIIITLGIFVVGTWSNIHPPSVMTFPGMTKKMKSCVHLPVASTWKPGQGLPGRAFRHSNILIQRTVKHIH